MLDIDALLQPISPAAPCGEDLSFSSEFDAIQEARRHDDPSLDQGEWLIELKTADWQAVSRQCEQLLRERSKDLRLAVWLVEARARLDGFPGLADGYRLVARLCEHYWDSLHPDAEDGDQELRIGNLAWLLSQSAQWVRAIPLIDGPQGRYAAADLEAALRPRQPGDAGDEQRPDTTRIDAARATAPFEFYRRLAEEAPTTLEALRQLEAAVDARLGPDGPSFGAAREAVGDVVATALRFASMAGVAVSDEFLPPTQPASPGPAPATMVQSAPAPAAATPSPAPANAGEITSRKEALVQLRRVAEFFRRTEPHSPVAYLADKAARWGNMPLHVWLKSVIKDSSALSQLEELLDVNPDEPRPE
jgi:type VI secretion system protein ImpA